MNPSSDVIVPQSTINKYEVEKRRIQCLTPKVGRYDVSQVFIRCQHLLSTVMIDE